VRDFLKGKRCMVWSFMGNSRMYEALRDYGDRFDTVGILLLRLTKQAQLLKPVQASAACYRIFRNGLILSGCSQL